MARHRKTKAERDQEWRAADRAAWEQFRPRLESLQSYADAQRLLTDAPRPDSPGRRYYSNLAFFLGELRPPDGSSNAEKDLYIQLIQRMDARRELKPGARQKIEEDLPRAMEAQGP